MSTASNDESLATAPVRTRRFGRYPALLPRDLALIAMFAALIAALGLAGEFTVGGAVPITVQNLGVLLAGLILGPRRGFLAVLTFLVLTAAGLPLLPGGRGGLAPFVSPSGGYLLAWPLGALVAGLVVARTLPRFRLWVGILGGVLGSLAIYLVGVPWTIWKVGDSVGGVVLAALQLVPGDLIKSVVAALIAQGLYRAYPVPPAGVHRGETAETARSRA